MLKEHEWTCAAAVELTEGVRAIEKRLDNLPDNCMNTEQQMGFKETLPCVTRLRHTAVHRRHLTSAEMLKQVHSACMLAEVLRDEECRSRLQTIYTRVDTWVKSMNHDTEVVEQEAERRLRQLELLLQTTMAQQQNKISSAAGQGLIDSITTEFGPYYLNAAAEIKGTLTCDEYARNTGGIVLIDEDDIESDEDRLQTEL